MTRPARSPSQVPRSEGEVLTANTSALADADGLGTLIYQWKADGTNITGATASTYTLTQDEGAKAVSVVVSFTDGFGFIEVVESEATDPINRKPIINEELPAFVATEGSTETRDLAGQIFTDLDEGATLSTSVSQVNGDTVPEWLNINFDTGLISATPTAGSAGLYKFRAVAEDEFGAVTSQTFSISVIEDSPLNKVISVEAGDSSVTEAFGNNVVIAAEGNNQIVNFSGNGFVDAGADDDVVIGGRGDDILYGGSGNDVLIGDISRKFSPGDDVLVGGDRGTTCSREEAVLIRSCLRPTKAQMSSAQICCSMTTMGHGPLLVGILMFQKTSSTSAPLA